MFPHLNHGLLVLFHGGSKGWFDATVVVEQS